MQPDGIPTHRHLDIVDHPATIGLLAALVTRHPDLSPAFEPTSRGAWVNLIGLLGDSRLATAEKDRLQQSLWRTLASSDG